MVSGGSADLCLHDAQPMRLRCSGAPLVVLPAGVGPPAMSTAAGSCDLVRLLRCGGDGRAELAETLPCSRGVTTVLALPSGRIAGAGQYSVETAAAVRRSAACPLSAVQCLLHPQACPWSSVSLIDGCRPAPRRCCCGGRLGRQSHSLVRDGGWERQRRPLVAGLRRVRRQDAPRWLGTRRAGAGALSAVDRAAAVGGGRRANAAGPVVCRREARLLRYRQARRTCCAGLSTPYAA